MVLSAALYCLEYGAMATLFEPKNLVQKVLAMVTMYYIIFLLHNIIYISTWNWVYTCILDVPYILMYT